MNFPRHLSLHITHNGHKDYYEGIEDYLRERDDWISEEQKTKAIELNELWEVQWYPDTPIGFYIVIGADLDLVLARACSIQDAEDNPPPHQSTG